MDFKQDFIPGVTQRLWTPNSLWPKDRPNVDPIYKMILYDRMISRELPRRTERCRKDIMGPHAIEIAWEVSVLRSCAPTGLDDYIVAERWRIVERKDRGELQSADNPAVSTYKIQICLGS